MHIFKYDCNITEKFKKDTQKTIGRVDFTSYVLSAILQTPYS